MSTTTSPPPQVAARLSTLDRWLPVWIGLAMGAGLGLGRAVPGLGDALGAVQVDGISLPIAIGLLVMMYPVLAKVRYDRLGTVTADRRLLVASLVLNWVLGPALMFTLAWVFLADLPAQIAKSVLIFLGVPLAAGYLSRRIGEHRWGRTAYEHRFLPRVGPWALYGLLFTIVVLFALQGQAITSRPLDVARIALPLLTYFALMWGGGYLLGTALGLTYQRTTTLAFTAAGNNFELAIAVAIATFGATSGQALAGVVGPLVEVPVLVGLVYVSLALRRRYPHPHAPRRATAGESR